MASTDTPKKNEDHKDYEETAVPSAGCGILGRYPLLSLLVFAVLGICTGVGLSSWEDDGDTKDKVIKWLGLLGDLFIRALKCIVLPLIFVSVTLAVLDMLAIGRAGSIGWKTSKFAVAVLAC
jgi:Na+/H+-dicarboxylate symporter